MPSTLLGIAETLTDQEISWVPFRDGLVKRDERRKTLTAASPRESDATTSDPVPAYRSIATDIMQLSELRDNGVVTEAEFRAAKRIILGMAKGQTEPRP